MSFSIKNARNGTLNFQPKGGLARPDPCQVLARGWGSSRRAFLGWKMSVSARHYGSWSEGRFETKRTNGCPDFGEPMDMEYERHSSTNLFVGVFSFCTLLCSLQILLILDQNLSCFNFSVHSSDTSWTFN